MQDFDIIETPENVGLQRRLAGIGSRFLAGLLDSLIIALMYLILFVILLSLGLLSTGLDANLADTAGMVLFAVLILVAFLIYWGYFVLFEAWLNGQTPGKRCLKIRVVQQEGAAVALDAIVVRNLLRVVDMQGGYAVAGVSMFVTRKIQRLGDLAAGTVVISEEIQDYAAQYDKKQKLYDSVAPAAPHLASTGIKPEEYRLLQNYWLRRHELDLDARKRLLPNLIGPILERMGTVPENQSLATLEKHLDELMRQARGTDSTVPSGETTTEEQA